MTLHICGYVLSRDSIPTPVYTYALWPFMSFSYQFLKAPLNALLSRASRMHA